MTLAPWRPLLARALHRNRSVANARYLQLATVTESQRPANRSVVFRGFLDGTNQLKFVTDLRSAKIEHIHHCPWGEACWYFPKTREQFRISGRLLLVDHACSDQNLLRQRQSAWQALSDSAREQFIWPAPGTPKVEHAPSPATDAQNPVQPFCLLLLEPDRVDHLELRSPQQRCLYVQDHLHQWSVQPVNP